MNYNTHLDMCQFGLQDPFTKMPYRHRTKLVHNSFELHKSLKKLCPGDHEHQVTSGTTKLTLPDGTTCSINKSRFAGWYTPQFCDAVLDALSKELNTPIRARVAPAAQQPYVTLPSQHLDESQYAAAMAKYKCDYPNCNKMY